jgi:selenocysteine lyase/cysteine desulfurase
VNVRELKIDVLVAGAFKWLLAIPGVAVFFIDENVLPKLRPDRAGWASMQTDEANPPHLPWHEDAMRFCPGSPSESSIVALESSLALTLEVGIPAIQARTLSLVDRAANSLEANGFVINSSMDPKNRSAILSFTTGSPDKNKELHEKLLEKGIIVSLRGGAIRVAPHFYNVEEEIDRLVEACRSFQESSL